MDEDNGQLVPYQPPTLPAGLPAVPPALTRLLSLTLSERLSSVTAADRAEIVAWLALADQAMQPIETEVLFAAIQSLFEAYDAKPLSAPARKHWARFLMQYPEWALLQAMNDCIAELPHRPQIADIIKRVGPVIAPLSTTTLQAQHILDYGREPEPDEPVSEERKAAVRAILEGIGIRKMETDRED